MPFVSGKRLAELEALEKKWEDPKQAQIDLDEEREDLKDRRRELEQEQRDARRELDEEYEKYQDDLYDEYEAKQRQLDRDNTVLKAENKRLESEAAADAELEAEKPIADLNKKIDDLLDQVRSRDDTIKSLQERVTTETDLVNREMNLTILQKQNETETAANASVRAQLDKQRKELDDFKRDKDAGEYKSGYTDGVSDTLREGNELASEANTRVFELAQTVLSKDGPTAEPVTINNNVSQ